MKLNMTDFKPNELCRIVREWTGLTQVEFGKSLHRTSRSIRMLESGETYLTVETLLRIAKIYKLKITIEKNK